ncbi:MAG: transposase [Treponema sp.]|nr:transposase [Treponema sp.]
MINKIDSSHGREVYLKRIGIVEPVFADIRTQKRLDHFTLRTQAKVNIQWLLYCIVHNLVKITNYGPALQTVWMQRTRKARRFCPAALP